MIEGSKYLTKPRPGVRTVGIHPLSVGLMGYWIMNEGGGLRIDDISNNGRSMTLGTNTGAQIFTTGGDTAKWVGSPLGGCLKFDGTDDALKNILSDWFQGSRMTVSAWINSNDFSQLKTVVDHRARAGGPPSQTDQFSLFTSATGNIKWMVSSNFGVSINVDNVGASVMTTGKWYHIVGTYDGANSRCYLNGVLDGTVASSGSIGAAVVNAGLLIGSDGETAGRYFNGYIDEVRIYNRALSQSEVSLLYSSPHADFPYFTKYWSPLANHFKFNNQGIRPRPFAPGLAK